MNKPWKLQEIVVGVLISAVFGVVLMAWSNLYIPLTPVLGPVGIELLYGLYFAPGILVMYIIRKPGAAILGGVVSALVELLLGSPFGFVNIFLAGLIQGFASEVVFFLFHYDIFNIPVMALAGAASAILIFVRDYFAFGYSANPAGVLAAMLVVRIVSGAVLGGVLSKLIGDALAKTGVLANYRIAQKG